MSTDQFITITPTDTNLSAYDISATDLIQVVGINSGADSSIKYQINNREVTTINVQEAPATLVTSSELLIPVTLLSDGSTVYVNATRVKRAYDNGSGCQFFLDTEAAAWLPYQVTESLSALQVLINAVADTTPIPLAQHITATTQSTSVSTGALVVDGGVGIAKNTYVGGLLNVAGQVNAAATTASTTSTTGALITGGGAGIAGALFAGTTVNAGTAITSGTTITAGTGVITDSITEKTAGAGITLSKNTVRKSTLTALNTTGTITAAIVNKGGITSTSAATVTATLDTATNIGTQVGAAQGTIVDFVVDNLAGSNVVTVAVATGITAVTAVVTGSDTLTVASGASGLFRLYFTSATVAKLSRVF